MNLHSTYPNGVTFLYSFDWRIFNLRNNNWAKKEKEQVKHLKFICTKNVYIQKTLITNSILKIKIIIFNRGQNQSKSQIKSATGRHIKMFLNKKLLFHFILTKTNILFSFFTESCLQQVIAGSGLWRLPENKLNCEWSIQTVWVFLVEKASFFCRRLPITGSSTLSWQHI